MWTTSNTIWIHFNKRCDGCFEHLAADRSCGDRAAAPGSQALRHHKFAGRGIDEITVAGAGAPGADEIRDAEFVVTVTLEDTPLLRALTMELDAGEAEAIACAVQSRADWLLIDERRGRSIAEKLGVRVIGTLGILIAAKRGGQLAEVKPALNELRERAGFWMSNDLMQRALLAASET